MSTIRRLSKLANQWPRSVNYRTAHRHDRTSWRLNSRRTLTSPGFAPVLGARRSATGSRSFACASFVTTDSVILHSNKPNGCTSLQLIEQMHLEIAAGATAHERVPRLVRYLPWTVALLDGLILYTFCADIFDAQTGELSRDGLAAMALAVLGSGITYAWLSMTGTRLRDYRAILGEICWRQTGLLTRTLVGIAAVISATLSVLMYERVSEQAQQASGLYVSPAQVPVLGLVFAILSLCANLTVVVVHALDGSSLAAHTRHAGLAIRRSERRLDRVRRIAWRRALRAEVCPDPLDERANTQPRSVIGGP